MRRPSSVRMGMFWRFGSLEEQAAGRRDRLVEGGVDAPVARVDQLGQRVEVGALELRRACGARGPRAGSGCCSASFSSTSCVGGRPGLGAAQHRQLELLEEHLRQLGVAVDVEDPAGQRVQLRLEVEALGVHVARQLGQHGQVHLDAVALHPGQHRDKRQLQLAGEPGQPGRLDVPPTGPGRAAPPPAPAGRTPRPPPPRGRSASPLPARRAAAAS